MIKVIGQKKNLFLNVKLYFPIGMKKKEGKRDICTHNKRFSRLGTCQDQKILTVSLPNPNLKTEF